MKIRDFLCAVSLVALISAPVVAKKVEMTPMQLQALQTHEYKTTKDQVFASVVSVFQDLGYQVAQADMGSGFITAESANKNKTNVLQAFAGMSASGHTRATAFIEQMPSGMSRVRLNFLNTKNSSTAYGRSSADDKPVLDPQTYQTAFNRIDEALFERGALTKTATPQPPTVEIPVTAKTSIVDPAQAEQKPKP
ncbi:hypothetical protein KZX46_20835 [Polymorphobacter sp. PAMC 29334]|uniref:hypothetical protein n=1 Tax=Polymorphobacter sp. PAMC 29334 TaxID=2862331 RepID=UPI001C793523|nr:hypothetical protein [Polymorphobacter sp. PAMC 29334]QYE35125.1 hypothetical protein KZX46_20835 [Polymorphobacter sp. PAMC 29334]